MAVFYAAPFVHLAQESFTSWEGEDTPRTEPTLHYYAKTFSSSRSLRAFARTFRISIISTIIALIICFPIALMLIRAGPKVRSGVLLVIFISLASSLIVRNYGWLVVLSDQGPLNALLVGLGLTDRGIRMVYSEGATIVALVHYVMPFMILPIYGSLLRIPDSYAEASVSLGAGPWSTLRRIVFPLAMPGIFGGTILSFAICMSAFVTPLMLGSPATAMMSQVAAEQLLVQQNFPQGSAMVVILTVSTFAVVLVYGLIIRKVFKANV
jgi:ABC-type spermidine/putrescine transport system permease subunit I